MPSNVVKYRIFIASPGGLDDIRRRFRTTLDEYNSLESVPRGVLFEPVGWEATLPGVGRPQALINEDIKTCDRAVFMFRDRWGSHPGEGSGFTSGSEEEWRLCTDLVAAGSMQGVQLFFLPVSDAQLKDPGPQLQQVLAFRQKLEDGRAHLFKNLRLDDEFAAELRAALGLWLRQHEASQRRPNDGAAGERGARQLPDVPSTAKINTSSGIAARLLKSAIDLLRQQAPISALPIIDAALSSEPPADVEAQALVAKGYVLGELGRAEEEIAVYDDLLARFGNAAELPLREQVARGLVNKGFRLGALGRSEEAIASFEELLARFGFADDPVFVDVSERALDALTQIAYERPDSV